MMEIVEKCNSIWTFSLHLSLFLSLAVWRSGFLYQFIHICLRGRREDILNGE